MNILDWINGYRSNFTAEVNQVSLSELEHWHYENGIIKRKDSAFFSVFGIKSDNCSFVENELPIINQAEIGILGFLISGDKILLHAKSEPGNIGITHIGPSVQATESNYKIRHGGKGQNYLNFFLDENRPKLVWIKQSEQGTRFLNKYNRNAIIEIQEDEIEIKSEKYRWFDLKEVIKILNTNHLFNTDFKSVISHLFERQILQQGENSANPLLSSYFNNRHSDSSETIQRLEQKREKLQFSIKHIPLSELKNWTIDDIGIHPKDKLSFGYGYYNISMHDREVLKWGQPLVTKESTENLILLATIINGEYHFIFRERPELGFKNYMQLGPTIQTDNPANINFKATEENTIVSFRQSEEGGRFYQNDSKYKICLTDKIEHYKNSNDYHILNLYQICSLLKTTGIFSNEARSVISGLLPLISQ